MLSEPTIDKKREIICRVSQGDFIATIATKIDLMRQLTSDDDIAEQLSEITSELMFVQKIYRLV